MVHLHKISSVNWVFAAIIAGTCCLQPACNAQTPTGQIQSEPTATSKPQAFEKSKRIQGVDWPQFLGLGQDGTSPETGIHKNWADGNLPVLWSRKFGTGYGIGSVASGRYLQFHRVGDNERLTCLNAETGAEIWNADYPVRYEDMYGYNNGPRTSPTIDGDLVFTMGVAGRLTCRSLEDGRERWAVDTNEKYGVVQNFFGVGCSPLVVDNLVIVMVGGSPAEDQRIPTGQLDRVSANGSALVAFDKVTGKERYRVGDYLASYASLRTMKADDETLVLGFVREGLLAVTASTGREAWMFPWRADSIESVNAAVPVIREDQVLISECYQIASALLQVDRDGYKVLRTDSNNRRLQTFRAHWATPIRVGEALFGCSGRNPPDSDLRCVDWNSGEVLWSDDRRERSSLLGIDGHFVVLNERGRMELIKANPNKYEPVTSIDLSRTDAAIPARPALRYPCWAAPIVSHGLLYVRGEETVICFELIPEPSN